MDIGAFIAASGAKANQRILEEVTHNLANASTPGFKERLIAKEAFPYAAPGSEQTGIDPLAFVQAGPPVVDNTQGVVEPTGRPLDIAIVGKGTFQVRTPEGVRGVRDGRLSLDRDGTIVTSEGYPVQSEQGGEIHIDPKKGVEISEDGEVRSGERSIGRLLIADEKGRPVESEDYRLVQGHLESSNVNSIEEMIKMMELVRDHGAYMKVIKSFDDLEGKTIQDLGRL